MNIAIAGGRGFLGRALADRLVAEGHKVLVLSRAAVPSPPWRQARSEVAWQPGLETGTWAAALEGADAIVNLAGESIADGRWTAVRKREILQSRVVATSSLVRAIESMARPPTVFVSASAQGYYGDRGDEVLTEASPPGAGFLPEVCRRWEQEALAAAGRVRVVLLRTGIVLDRRAGALPRMVLPFKLFGGGTLGSGRQFMSWIHVDDWVGMTLHALANQRVEGPRNLGTPNPVRNREFASALGRALHRPHALPAPAFALRLALGEMADPLLLASTRMIPEAATAEGYRFAFPDLAGALGAILP